MSACRRRTTPPAIVTTGGRPGPSARSSSWDAISTVAPVRRGVADEAVDQVAAAWSRPAWGSSSSHSSGRRATSAASDVRRRWPADSRRHRHVGQAPVEAERGEGGVGVVAACRPRPGPRSGRCRPRSGRRRAPVAWPSRPTRRRTDRRSLAQVVAQHDAPRPRRRARGRRRRAAAWSCRRRWAPEQDDLAAAHVEVDPGQGGEPAEQRHRGAEVDDGLHGTRRGYRPTKSRWKVNGSVDHASRLRPAILRR